MPDCVQQATTGGEKGVWRAGGVALLHPPGDAVGVVLRTESPRVTDTGDTPKLDNSFQGVVELKAFEGPATYYEVRVDGLSTTLKISASSVLRSLVFDRGDQVWVSWSSDQTPLIILNSAP